MTHREAIEQLIVDKFVIFANAVHPEKISLDEFRIAINAIERQIPKKVTHEASVFKCCTCPMCKNVVDEFTDFMGKRVRVTYHHCRFCGQALDWSDTE